MKIRSIRRYLAWGGILALGIMLASGCGRGETAGGAASTPRAARSDQPRFIDHGDGTMTDTATELMWTKNAGHGPLNWANAVSYCTDLRVGGYSDWRLPTVHRDNHPGAGGGQHRAEIDRIGRIDADMNKGWSRALLQDNFEQAHTSHYWTGTTSAENADEAWFTNLTLGYVGAQRKGAMAFVWPVRGGR